MIKPILPTLELSITSLSHDGRGISLIEGKTAFINGALAHEKVQCKITKKHSRYYEAETLTVLSASSLRTTPPCPHFSICGGCSLQHMHTDAQIQFKQQALLDQLKHFGRVVPKNILPPLSGNTLGYRRKARLGVRFVKNKERVLVGFREKNSNFLAEIDECLVLHPHIGKNLKNLSQLIAQLTEYQHIPQVEVAVGDTECALVFRHLVALPETDIKKLCAFGATHRFQIYLQPNSPNKVHKIWPCDNQETLQYALTAHQLTLHFHPLDFTQINGEMNPLMIQQALTLLDIKPTETVLDLFCGLGNFTLPIARFAKHVTGIEGSHDSIKRAEMNAAVNHIENASFHLANLMDPLLQAAWLNNQYDKILLDPPRTGAKEIIPLLKKFNAKRIVYVSCNPATLARDAGEIVHQLGFKLTQTGLINMFPHTNHIETMALFEK